MNIVYVYFDHPIDHVSFQWYCAIPANAINRTQRHTARLLSMKDFVENSPVAEKLCGQADIIIIHRRLIGKVLSVIQKWKAQDKLIYLYLDFSVDYLVEEMSEYKFWYLGETACQNGDCLFGKDLIDPRPNEQLSWGLRLIDGVISSSERLADDFSHSVKSNYLPGFIEVDHYLNQTRSRHPGLLIGLGGDQNLLPGFRNSGVLEALGNVINKRNDVGVVVFGGDQRIYDAIQAPLSQKFLWPLINYEEWPRYLSKIDIGLAPACGDFDLRRGYERILEYMIMKIPWIGSDTPGYRKFSSYGWLVPNSVQSWEQVILEMVDHLEDYRIEASGEPYLFALSKDVDENINKILMAYEWLKT